MEEETKKSNVWKVVAIILLVIIVLGAGGYGWYYYYRKDVNNKADITKLQNEINTKKGTGTTTSATCEAEALTQTEKDLSGDWATETNDKYNYTFKHPTDWEKTLPGDNPNDFLSFVDVTDEATLAAINLIVFSADQATKNTGEGLNVEEEKTVQVGCVDATYKVYTTEDNPRGFKQGTIRTTFEKGGVPFLIGLTYPSIGASMDSDIIEAYDLVLKTFTFK